MNELQNEWAGGGVPPACLFILFGIHIFYASHHRKIGILQTTLALDITCILTLRELTQWVVARFLEVFSGTANHNVAVCEGIETLLVYHPKPT